MAGQIVQSRNEAVWRLVRCQHGVVTRPQLLKLGFSAAAVDHRIATGRLHPIYSGVFAVGRSQLDKTGRWQAAILACGPLAALSHDSAAVVWGVRPARPGPIHVSVPPNAYRRRPGIVAHRRANLDKVIRSRHGLAVTSPVRTLIDLGTRLLRHELEAAVNQADKLDLVDPQTLRASVDQAAGQPGVRFLRAVLDRHTFTLTDSELERRFLPLARRAGLPRPKTRTKVNGYRVDFHWPALALVVETDGLRYHRTPAQQTRDRLRDQAHAAAGLVPLRFTRAQVRFEPGHVVETLVAVTSRLVAQGSRESLVAASARR